MYARRDILSARGLATPSNWEDLLDLAAEVNGTDFNGDGVPDRAICINGELMLYSISPCPMLLHHKSHAAKYLERTNVTIICIVLEYQQYKYIQLTTTDCNSYSKLILYVNLNLRMLLFHTLLACLLHVKRVFAL